MAVPPGQVRGLVRPSRADRSARRPQVVPPATSAACGGRHRRARTATRCRATAPRYAAPSSAPADACGGSVAISASARRAARAKARSPAARVPGWRRAECRPRTWPNNRPARRGQMRDRPCRAARMRDGSGRPSSQARVERGREQLEAAQRDIGHQFVAVAEMPIGRGRTDAGPARGLGKGEAGGTLLRDQFQRGAQQRLLEIAVVIAARSGVFPAHVKRSYMSRPAPSTGWARRPQLSRRCASAQHGW